MRSRQDGADVSNYKADAFESWLLIIPTYVYRLDVRTVTDSKCRSSQFLRISKTAAYRK